MQEEVLLGRDDKAEDTHGTKALDKEAAEQTEQHNEEHDDFLDAVAAITAASDVLEFAKNKDLQSSFVMEIFM